MIHNYVPSNTIFTNKDELISDKEYNIYQAALKFDSSRGAKFSTYLGNETKWMCLNIYNKNKKHPEIATEELYLDLNQDFSTNDHEKNIERELFKKIMELLKDYPDSRISQIFSMRYVEGSKNKVMPWKEVSQKIDMSIQGCINIHDATVQKLKIKLKEI
jgi:DNA-directed RNA polymerase sigma subunit (sigma70/sigma32)